MCQMEQIKRKNAVKININNIYKWKIFKLFSI